jgi:hypothetical protein
LDLEDYVHHRPQSLIRWLSAAALGLALMGNTTGALGASKDLLPQSPAAFLPGGMLGIQLGGSWRASKHNPSLHKMDCQAVKDASDFDEVCFFRTSGASRVAGAEIHDGFIAGKDGSVVLVGTGISIKNAEDPLAEAVVQSFQAQVNSAFQQTGDNVLFVKLPARHMSAKELAGFSKTAPVLLVQMEAKSNELAILYGYLAPVNAFGALTAD